ncbi:MAG: RIP metalloprotease RseP [Desulfatibacillaceae bacterium]
MDIPFVYYLTVIPLLGILIFIHELGHFLVARAFGVGVEIFSLGFGPRITGKQSGMTDYRLSAIPLGGYVKMVGEDPAAAREVEDTSISFAHKPLHQRTLIVLAGPVSNLVLAPLLLFGLYAGWGNTVLAPVIGEVQKDRPAMEAGLRAGDKVMAVNGNQVDSWDDMSEYIQKGAPGPVDIIVERGDGVRKFSVLLEKTTVQDMFGDEKQKYLVGIAPSYDISHIHLGPGEAMGQALSHTWQVGYVTIKSIARIFQGKLAAKEALGGPIMIAQMAGSTAKNSFADFLKLCAMLSATLGLINLFPVPVLDGGHLAFFAYEAVARKPLSLRVREFMLQVGFVLLIMLMAYIIYIDIARSYGPS